MCHVYGLNYPNYDIKKNKIEIKNLHILFGLNGNAVSNEVNHPRCVLFCMFFPASLLTF